MYYLLYISIKITDPDCYQLVSKQDIIHVSTTTATESTQTDGNNIA